MDKTAAFLIGSAILYSLGYKAEAKYVLSAMTTHTLYRKCVTIGIETYGIVDFLPLLRGICINVLHMRADFLC